tara:strand:+ start:5657 stop:6562 length:906 start_codon:yes stop_codon:yes gene_type:complete
MGNDIQQTFYVGSDWLYYRIYSGYKTSDFILTEIIRPLTEDLEREGLIRKWFFIRYSDPKHHLRVRFMLQDKSGLDSIVYRIHDDLNQMVEQDLIWNIEIGTYQRELNRYGKNSMEFSESLFFYQSKVVVSFLSLIEGEEGEQMRWMFGLRMVDHLLDAFNYEIEDKLKLLYNLKIGFGNEFGMTRALKKQLDDKYRARRMEIEEFMSFTETSQPIYAPFLNVLNSTNELSNQIIREILKIYQSGRLEMQLDIFLESHIHMLMNRIFRSKNRLNEMVSYDFLYRYYKSLSAKIKLGKASIN